MRSARLISMYRRSVRREADQGSTPASFESERCTLVIHEHAAKSETRGAALAVAELDRRHWPAKTLAESSRLYSPAIARLTPLTMVETGLPSFSNCSAQYWTGCRPACRCTRSRRFRQRPGSGPSG